MAFTTTFTSGDFVFPAYNIDFAVGPGVRGNEKADVMLVQALLRMMYFEAPHDQIGAPPGLKGLDVDGILGRNTLRAMTFFQDKFHFQFGGKEFLRDGVYDPFRSHDERSHVANVHYILEALNNMLLFTTRKAGKPDAYQNLSQRTDIPVPLKAELSSGPRDVARQYAFG